MNIGDYVRTKYGNIGKIIEQNDYNVVINSKNNMELFISKEDNIKSSSNIIDLIEVGDYVNGYKVYEENGYLWIKRVSDDKYKVPHYTRIDFEEFKIKSIVTKEQFESMEYKAGE